MASEKLSPCSTRPVTHSHCTAAKSFCSERLRRRYLPSDWRHTSAPTIAPKRLTVIERLLRWLKSCPTLRLSRCRKQERGSWIGTRRVATCTFPHPPGSRARLLSPSPLRTARASFPACRSSLANAPCGTRGCHALPWDHRHQTRWG